MTKPASPSEVARHPIDRELTLRILTQTAGTIEACRDGLNRGNTSSLSSLFLSYVRHIGFVSGVDPASPEIDRSLQLASEAGAALFQVASAPPEAEAEVSLGEGFPSRLRNTLTNDLVNVGDWHTAFLVSAISRNSTALDALCRTPIDLLRRSVSRTDEYYFLYAQALQAFWKREDDTPDRLMAALEATDPDGLPEHHVDFVLHIIVPEMDLLFQYLDEEASEETFNAALVQALESHKEFYQKANRRRVETGFLALGPLAMCCFAVDSGMAVTVQSDYLLPRPIEGIPADGGGTPAE